MNRKVIFQFFMAVLSVVLLLLMQPQRLPASKSESHIIHSDSTLSLAIDNSMSDFDLARNFDREVVNFMRRWELKGATFALMRNDSLLYAKGYGSATDSLDCDASHHFRVASVSKLVTATAIMTLVERGALTLDSKVFGAEGILCDPQFLDLQSSSQKLITVDHLLRHTAGFSSPYGDPAFSNYSIARFLERDLPLTLDDMVLYATRNRIRTRPGGSYDYSNLGYMVLTKIIEKVTHQPYERYVQDSVLHPIGCYDFYIGQNFKEDRPEGEVDYFEVKEAVPVEAYDGSGRITMKSNGGNNVNLLGGAGGWVTTSTDLLRFVAAINGVAGREDILSRESIATMTSLGQNQHPIGWASIRGADWIRSGSMAGTSALIKRQGNGYTWVFISNSSAWIGPRISNYISSHITRAISKVKRWPAQNLFEVEATPLAESDIEGADL